MINTLKDSTNWPHTKRKLKKCPGSISRPRACSSLGVSLRSNISFQGVQGSFVNPCRCLLQLHLSSRRDLICQQEIAWIILCVICYMEAYKSSGTLLTILSYGFDNPLITLEMAEVETPVDWQLLPEGIHIFQPIGTIFLPSLAQCPPCRLPVRDSFGLRLSPFYVCSIGRQDFLSLKLE